MKVLHSYHYLNAHLFNSTESAVKIACTSMKNKHIKFANKLLSSKNKALNINDETSSNKSKKYSDLRFSLAKHIFDTKLTLKISPESLQELVKPSVSNNITSNVQTFTSENNSFNEPIYGCIEEIETSSGSVIYCKLDFPSHTNTEPKQIASESTIYSEIVFSNGPNSKQNAAEPIYAKVDLSKKKNRRPAAEPIYAKVDLSKKKNRRPAAEPIYAKVDLSKKKNRRAAEREAISMTMPENDCNKSASVTSQRGELMPLSVFPSQTNEIF